MRFFKWLALACGLFAATGAAQADTLADIQKAGVIRIGTGVMGLKPWIWQTPDGKYHGIEAELSEYIAEKLGVKPEFIVTEWSTLIPGLKASRWDVFISSVMKTEERVQGAKIQFSNPYILSYILVLVDGDSPVKNMDDMKDKVIASVAGSGDSLVAHSIVDKGLAKSVQDFDSFNQTFIALQNKQVDAVVTDQNTLPAQKEQMPGLRVVGGPFYFIPKKEWAEAQAKADYVLGGYSVGIRAEDETLRAKINEILAEMDKSGARKAILSKYDAWSPEQENLLKK